MSATHDKHTQVIKVGALVELNAEVVENGIGFISEKYPPLLLTFNCDEAGDVIGYQIDTVKRENADIHKVHFVKAIPERRPAIIGLNGKGPKIILPPGA